MHRRLFVVSSGGVPPFCMTTTLFTMSIGASGIVGGWTGIEYLITGSSPSLAACLYTASFGAFMGAVFSAPEHLALLMISVSIHMQSWLSAVSS